MIHRHCLYGCLNRALCRKLETTWNTPGSDHVILAEVSDLDPERTTPTTGPRDQRENALPRHKQSTQ